MTFKKLPSIGKEFIEHYTKFYTDLLEETGDTEWRYKLDYLNDMSIKNPFQEVIEESTEWDVWEDAIEEVRNEILSEKISLMKQSQEPFPDSFIKGSFRVVTNSGEIPYEREYAEDEDIYNFAFRYEYQDPQFIGGCYSHQEIPRNIFLDESYSDATIRGYFDKIQGKVLAELSSPQDYVDYVYGYYLVDFVSMIQQARWEVNHHNDNNPHKDGKFVFNAEKYKC